MRGYRPLSFKPHSFPIVEIRKLRTKLGSINNLPRITNPERCRGLDLKPELLFGIVILN